MDLGKLDPELMFRPSDEYRIKAMLSFDEEEHLKAFGPAPEIYTYKNRLGKEVFCQILVERENGEVIVQNKNGCKVCLSKKDLQLFWKLPK